MPTAIETMLVRSPDVCGGRLRLDGTRITVQQIVTWYKQGYSPEEIAVLELLERFPILPDVDAAVRASLGVLQPDLADQAWHGGECRSDLIAETRVLRFVYALESEGHDQNMHGILVRFTSP